MNSIIMYGYENSELADYEALNRGYRQIYVLKGNEIFVLNVYDIVRLQQDFETEIESSGFFGIEPNIIIVKEVTVSNIRFTIEKLSRQFFFDNLKSVDKSILKLKRLVKLE